MRKITTTSPRRWWKRLRQDTHILGLVAVGSMAATATQPDRWSDHDFLVICEAGRQEGYRRSLDWLPAYRPVVLALRETQHGLKVLYDDGHLLEFAVFDPEEFRLARLNSRRVLLDRGGINELVEAVAAETQAWAQESEHDDDHLVGMFLSNLLVGAGRYARGERLSGRRFIQSFAVEHLLRLLARHLPPEQQAPLDNLDPFRRFELAYPDLGAEINRALDRPAPESALALLDLAERELAPRLPAYPREAAKVVRKLLAVSD